MADATMPDNVNKQIAGLTPYEPGKPEEELARELGISDILKLASNENPRGPGPQVRAALIAEADRLTRYPDGHCYELKVALSAYLDRPAEQITLGNGSNELLDLIGRVALTVGTEGIISQHCFVAYPLAVVAAGGTLVSIKADRFAQDLEATLAAVTERTRLIYIANPNNPTGTWHTHAQIENFMQRLDGRVWVVLDQAYAEYIDAADFPDGLALQAQFDNLVMTRSFSKVYGLAALRVGYSVSSPRMADLLNRVRLPFNVNRFAQVAAVAALADQAYVVESRELNQRGLQQMGAGLSALGLSYIPSIGNFYCVDFGRTALPIYAALLRLGVIVRPIGGYELPQHLRITIGSEAENVRLLDALKEVI